MHTISIATSTTDSALDPVAWNDLAGGVPMRSTAWMLAWAGQWIGHDRVMILVAKDETGQTRGLLPLVRDSRHPRRLRFFGHGQICTDHVSMLVRDEDRQPVAAAIADALISLAGDRHDGWDALDWDGIAAGDAASGELLRQLRLRGATIDLSSRMSLWFKPAADHWDEFLKRQSKRSRGRMRQLLRSIDESSDLSIQWATTPEDAAASLDALIDLHQQRWRSVGQPGTYADESMRQFIHHVTAAMFRDERVYLPTLRQGDRIIAAELNLIGDDGRFYVYSTGVDHSADANSPGAILNASTLKHVHDVGGAGVDYLRGDEIYKQRLAADAIPMMHARVTPPTMRGRCIQRLGRWIEHGKQHGRRWRNRPLVRAWTIDEAFPDVSPYADSLPRTHRVTKMPGVGFAETKWETPCVVPCH